MRGKIRGDNKGFSLIELIVAVLILGILSGLAIAAFSTVMNARVGAAAQTVKNAMKQTRTKAIGLKTQKDTSTNIYELDNYSVYADFYLLNGNYYVDIKDKSGKVWSSDKIGNDNLKIEFSKHDDLTGSKYEVGEGISASNYAIRVFFAKGTGAITKIEMYHSGGGSSGGANLSSDTITITGSSDKKELILVWATGRCYFSEETDETEEDESATPAPDPDDDI